MTHTLIGFLGKGTLDPQTGYRTTRYRFPDGSIRETPFFSQALFQYLQTDPANKADGMMLLGTQGSMWGVLVENLSARDERIEARLELREAESRGAVTEDLLHSIQPIVEQAFGCRVRLGLIPYGRDESEQIDILKTIAESTPKGRVSFDLTHGFRHLGMVGFMAAFMLERIHAKKKVDGLWYGALDMMQNGIAPVIRLDGLMRVHQWISALDRHSAGGDYGGFADLLRQDGLDRATADCLRQAAFHEGNSNVAEAARQLQPVLQRLSNPLIGPSALFQTRLRNRLQWAAIQDPAVQQLRMAELAFERGDYLRSTILAIEAVVTRGCIDSDIDPWNTVKREEVKKQLLQQAWKSRQPVSDDFLALNSLRNALAHSAPPTQSSIKQLLQQPESLRCRLGTMLKHVADLVDSKP